MRGRGPSWLGPPWARQDEEPGEGFPPGPGPWGRAWGPGAGGARARRGDVRSATLALLAERPMHGYELISEISQRTEGLWQPSPGSIYPTLQLLEDEGLITAEPDEQGSRRRYSLTEEGRRAAGEVTSRPLPWEQFKAPPNARAFGYAARSLIGAFRQVLMAGDADQQDKAVRVLDQARRELYSILASGQAATGSEDASEA